MAVLKTLHEHLGTCEECAEPVYKTDRRWCEMRLAGPIDVHYRWWHWVCYVPWTKQRAIKPKLSSWEPGKVLKGRLF
jgi:hypothetical protein